MVVDQRVVIVIQAMLREDKVKVSTEERDFEGRVWEVGKSVYEPYVHAMVVDRSGKVHYFRANKHDAIVNGVGAPDAQKAT